MEGLIFVAKEILRIGQSSWLGSAVLFCVFMTLIGLTAFFICLRHLPNRLDEKYGNLSWNKNFQENTSVGRYVKTIVYAGALATPWGRKRHFGDMPIQKDAGTALTVAAHIFLYAGFIGTSLVFILGIFFLD